MSAGQCRKPGGCPYPDPCGPGFCWLETLAAATKRETEQDRRPATNHEPTEDERLDDPRRGQGSKRK